MTFNLNLTLTVSDSDLAYLVSEVEKGESPLQVAETYCSAMVVESGIEYAEMFTEIIQDAIEKRVARVRNEKEIRSLFLDWVFDVSNEYSQMDIINMCKVSGVDYHRLSTTPLSNKEKEIYF